MKVNKILMFAAVAAMGLGLASCSKDYAKDVEGTYEGSTTVSMTMNGTTMPFGTVDASLVVKAEDENTVSVTVPGYSYQESMTLPSFTVQGVEVSKDGKNYNLKKDQFEVKAGNMTFKGAFDGTVTNGKLAAKYSVGADMMPHSIDFEFTTK